MNKEGCVVVFLFVLWTDGLSINCTTISKFKVNPMIQKAIYGKLFEDGIKLFLMAEGKKVRRYKLISLNTELQKELIEETNKFNLETKKVLNKEILETYKFTKITKKFSLNNRIRRLINYVSRTTSSVDECEVFDYDSLVIGMKSPGTDDEDEGEILMPPELDETSTKEQTVSNNVKSEFVLNSTVSVNDSDKFIETLKSICFIKDGNYVVASDYLVLKPNFIFAYGDSLDYNYRKKTAGTRLSKKQVEMLEKGSSWDDVYFSFLHDM
jgi:hypothetical protein